MRNNYVWAFFAICVVGALILGNESGKSGRYMVVETNRKYEFVSAAVVDYETAISAKTKVFLFVIVYDNEQTKKGKTKQACAVRVAVQAMKIDPSLPPSTVVWDNPVTIDGYVYQFVRWNPEASEKDGTTITGDIKTVKRYP